MEQKLFSKSVEEFLQKAFPGFVKTIKYQDDDSFDCSLKSASRIFLIWIATYNSEITIGIEDPTGDTSIHTHISCYELEDLQSCLSDLTNFINDIKGDKLILYQKANGKYDWIESSKFDSLKDVKRFSWN
jgi:hypothetical protein